MSDDWIATANRLNDGTREYYFMTIQFGFKKDSAESNHEMIPDLDSPDFFHKRCFIRNTRILSLPGTRDNRAMTLSIMSFFCRKSQSMQSL